MSLNLSKYPGIDLIAHFEGCHLKAYLCPAGIPTIGYGSTKGVTAKDVTNGRTITRSEAEDQLVRDYVAHRDRLLSAQPALSKLPAHQLGALVSLAFNVGVGAAAGSTAVRKAIAGDTTGAAAALLLWDKATVNGKKVVLPGLTRRRRAEARLFLLGQWVPTP